MFIQLPVLLSPQQHPTLHQNAQREWGVYLLVYWVRKLRYFVVDLSVVETFLNNPQEVMNWIISSTLSTMQPIECS